MALALRRYVPTAFDRQLRYALCSVLAVLAAMVFLFTMYGGLSTSLRTPLETFTIAGFGIPWISFTPTLDNWIDQLQVPETQDALVNSTLIATFATLLALALGTPAAYALARFRFELVHNRDLAIFKCDLGLSERLIPLFPKHVIAVSESGIFTGADAARVRKAGAHAILCGEALMKAPDTTALIEDFRRDV